IGYHRFHSRRVLISENRDHADRFFRSASVMVLIFPFAIVLPMSTAWAMRSIGHSAAKRAPPVTFKRPSTRPIGWPIIPAAGLVADRSCEVLMFGLPPFLQDTARSHVLPIRF